MKLKKLTETSKGLNTAFTNVDSGRTILLKQAIRGIRNNNSSYENYNTSYTKDGTPYVRSNPDKSKRNNIE